MVVFVKDSVLVGLLQTKECTGKHNCCGTLKTIYILYSTTTYLSGLTVTIIQFTFILAG